jgi:hypothetical protein
VVQGALDAGELHFFFVLAFGLAPRGAKSWVIAAFSAAEKAQTVTRKAREGGIDASRLQSHAGGHESVLAGPATHVQDPASNGARFRQRQKGRLRPPEIPRRRALSDGA